MFDPDTMTTCKACGNAFEHSEGSLGYGEFKRIVVCATCSDRQKVVAAAKKEMEELEVKILDRYSRINLLEEEIRAANSRITELENIIYDY